MGHPPTLASFFVFKTPDLKVPIVSPWQAVRAKLVMDKELTRLGGLPYNHKMVTRRVNFLFLL